MHKRSPVRRRRVYWCIIEVSPGFVSVGMRNKKLGRNAAAWICMAAVALLYAPLAGAALVASGIGCCAGAYCPIRSHHHKTQKPAAPQDSLPMDCEHAKNGRAHAASGMLSCSMSCCQDGIRPALIPGAFPLPEVTALPTVDEAAQPIDFTQPSEISRLSKPHSPPPRSGASVL